MSKMTSLSKAHLHIDIETYCELDLPKVGIYAYAAHESFEILLLAYKVGDGAVEVIDFAQGEEIPNELITMILDDEQIKMAHNATFERVCLSAYFRKKELIKTKYLSPRNWRCTAVRATVLGMPRSLETVGEVLGLPQEKAKLSTGKQLINYFCKPCKATRTNNFRTRNLPHHDLERWNLFKEYNAQDVVAEYEIDRIENTYTPTTDKEFEIWELDQRINDEGVAVDMVLVDSILDYTNDYTAKLLWRAKEITGLANPNSLPQAKRWLASRGISVDSLTKDDVKELRGTITDESALEYLEIRSELGKTSVAKFDAMKRAAVWDEDTKTYRIHGMLMFYGAMRTGRWAGRIVQLQNLPQNKYSDLDTMHKLVRNREWDWVDLMYPNNMEVASQLIRTALVPEEGNVFLVADYSAIEARIIAWLVNEKWKMEVFEGHGKIYEATAARMFGIPIETITHGSVERAKGKIAELAGGYGGGVAAYEAMGAASYGWDTKEIQILVNTWREANSEIVNYWYKSEDAVKGAIESPGLVTRLDHDLAYVMQHETLFNRLPSGRALAYRGAQILLGAYGRKEIAYLGENPNNNRYELIKSYGGKIVENQVQATARDVLAWAMAELDKKGFKIRFHVHDEIVLEIPADSPEELDAEIREIMALKNVSWTAGLNLQAESYRCAYYLKQ